MISQTIAHFPLNFYSAFTASDVNFSLQRIPRQAINLRKDVYKRQHLDRRESVLCVSTQLIEAGVDVDFGAVIRYAAGLDSIAQAAGRCNRNGRNAIGRVHIVNPREQDESLERLLDIRIGRDKTCLLYTSESPARSKLVYLTRL